MADGSFDPLHHGHIAYLRAAASLGYPLLVNLCPDAETAKKHPVLLPAKERAEVINAFGCVAYVHVSDRPTVDVLRELQPVIYVKGADWLDRLPKAIGQVCDELKIRIRYLDAPKASSTALLKQFQPDVDAFERLVLSQTPAETPWQPVTDYSWEARRTIEEPHAALIREVFQPQRVLDAACGPGHLVRVLFGQMNLDAYGFDLHPPLGDRFYRDDLTREHLFGRLRRQADLVVNRECLEHLTVRQIPRAVKNLCALSSKFVYGTTRFTPSPRHLLDFSTEYDVDPTHISCGTHEFLRMLFALEGFRYRSDLALRMDWKGYGRTFVFERAA